MTRNKKSPYIFSITGTKGKTTITRLLSHIYTQTGRQTLRVDTDGHYVNDVQKSNEHDSLQLHGILPATCPGKYLYELRDQLDTYAILETGFLSSKYGTGYHIHNIGIFTNVFRDHIGNGVKTQSQMAAMKSSYAFARIAPGGAAVFNADDQYVVNQLDDLPHRYETPKVPVGISFSAFDLTQHLNNDGKAVILKDQYIGIQDSKKFTPVLNVTDIEWTFGGHYQPSIYNLMFTIAAIYAESSFKTIPKKHIEAIRSYQLDQLGGRLTKLENKNKKITVIIDYAHESQSINAMANLAKSIATNKTIGIIRLQASRARTLLEETGEAIANSFDTLIIYDKIDGVSKKSYGGKLGGRKRGVGETAQFVFDAATKKQQPPHQAFLKIKEEEAISHAFSIAKPGDCIVHIANDDHAHSFQLIKQYLHA